MLYDPDWLSLLEARERLTARGAAQAEAETAICLALRDRKFRLQWTIEKVTYARTGATLDPTHVRALEFTEGSKLRLAIPANLKRADIDWDNSRLLRPQPYGPWQHQLLAHVAKLMISRVDFEREFLPKTTLPPVEAKGAAREETSPPNPSDSKQRKGYWARRAIDEVWPQGIPDGLPNKTIVWEVTKYANDKTREWTVGGPDTILRAAGRK